MAVAIKSQGGGSGYLIPAPFISINKNFIKAENGFVIRPDYTIAMDGTIVNVGTEVDSPAASGNGMAIDDIIAEQNRIKGLFASNNIELEITSPDTDNVILRAYCTVDNINFERDTWTTKCRYTIGLKTNSLLGDPEDEPSQDLNSTNESWVFNENDNSTVSVVHTLSATGAAIYASGGMLNGVQAAREWCNSHKVLATSGVITSTSGSLTTIANLSDTNNYWNRSVNEGYGSTNNSWQITETFIYNPEGSTREEYTISNDFDQADPRKVVVNISGSVIGYADREEDYDTQYTNARNRFYSIVDTAIYTRAATMVPSGYTLNPVYTSKQVTHEYNGGAVRYSVSFGATSGMMITGAIDESITINDTGCMDVFAQIDIPGRMEGPIIQNMNTKTAPSRSISITAVFPPNQCTLSGLRAAYMAKPNTNNIIEALCPESGYYYVTQETEEWNPIRRTYNRSISWTLDGDGNEVPGIPFSPHNLG